MKTATSARRRYAAGYIHSLRAQAEFARGLDRYIEAQRATLAPEDVEVLCIGCQWNRVLLFGAMCEDCRADSR